MPALLSLNFFFLSPWLSGLPRYVEIMMPAVLLACLFWESCRKSKPEKKSSLIWDHAIIVRLPSSLSLLCLRVFAGEDNEERLFGLVERRRGEGFLFLCYIE